METVNGEWIVPDGTILADSAYRDAFQKWIVPDGTILADSAYRDAFQKLKQREQMTIMEQLIMIHT
ncbi:hypothetical protein DXA21_22650 [Parabacteroides distasonis]|nr:hypothetical protein DXA21_22650 [Parabacteroides distasonis]